jgi:hypothetical protein
VRWQSSDNTNTERNFSGHRKEVYHPFRSLRHYYQQNGLPSLDQRLRWCHQAVSGFAYIHSHRSSRHFGVQPPFIFQFGYQNLRFWLCYRAGRNGLWTRGVPTQLRTICIISDIYLRLFCLGALFYEIILGKPPCEELSQEEVVRRYAEQKFPSLEDIEVGYAMIIGKCWHDEYSSIQDLICDLPYLPIVYI